MRSSGRSSTSPATARTESGSARASGSETWSIDTGSAASSRPTPSSSRTAATAVSASSTRRSGSPQPHHFIPADRSLSPRPGRNRLQAVERLVQRPTDRPPHHRRAETREPAQPPVERQRHLGVPVPRLEVDLGAGPAHEALEGGSLDGLLKDEALTVAFLDAAEVRPHPAPAPRAQHLSPAALGWWSLADVLDPRCVGPPAGKVVRVGDHGPERA